MTDKPIVVTVTRRIAAPPERIYDAWLDPKVAGRFLFATPTGRMVVAETDPRVGGLFRFTDRREGQDVEHTGQYLELDGTRRIVFSFAVAGNLASARVEIDIVPADEGAELTLTHEMAPEWVEFADRTRQGWSLIVEGLARVVTA